MNQKVLDIAKKYIGLNEHKDKAILKPFLGVSPASTPWCAAFINAVLKEAGIKGTGSNLARSFLKFGKETSSPIQGDIIVFRRGTSSWQGHVALYVGIKGDYYMVLGGNQGDKVCIQGYHKNLFLGARTYE